MILEYDGHLINFHLGTYTQIVKINCSFQMSTSYLFREVLKYVNKLHLLTKYNFCRVQIEVEYNINMPLIIMTMIYK